MRRSLRSTSLVGTAALALALSACSDDTPPPQSTGSSSSSGSDSTGDSTGDEGEPAGAFHFVVELENVGAAYDNVGSGVFDLPDGAATFGPAGPGQSFVMRFAARPGDHLTFVSMIPQSNDWFVGVADAGLALFDEEGQPLTGDRSGELALYDAGTEADEPLGQGANQPGVASGVGAPDSNGDIRVRPWADASLASGDLALDVSANLDAERVWQFEVRLQNDSAPGSISTTAGPVDLSLAPGAWAVHGAEGTWFEVGQPVSASPAAAAFEALVEDARTAPIAAHLFPATGVTQVVSAGVWAVSDGPEALLFAPGAAALDNGLEPIAEDGKFAALASFVENSGLLDFGVTEQSVVDYMNGPLPPGGIYRFEFDADPGAHLHLVHMFVPSNDWFIAPAAEGIDLFDVNGAPIMGPQTEQLMLWDAGTEVDQAIGFGLDQVHLQAGENTGAADPDDRVREISGPVPLGDILRLRILPSPN